VVTLRASDAAQRFEATLAVGYDGSGDELTAVDVQMLDCRMASGGASESAPAPDAPTAAASRQESTSRENADGRGQPTAAATSSQNSAVLSEALAARLILTSTECKRAWVRFGLDDPRLSELESWVETELNGNPDRYRRQQREENDGEWLDRYQYRDGQLDVVAEVSRSRYRSSIARGTYMVKTCVIIPERVVITEMEVDEATMTADVEAVVHWRMSPIVQEWRDAGFQVRDALRADSYMEQNRVPDLRRGRWELRKREGENWAVRRVG